MPENIQQPIIDEFRSRHGRVGGWLEGARLILLTTTGARSGQAHTVPLGFLHGGDGRLIVIASAGGAPTNPAWFHNLRANPKATVETGAFTFTAEATVLEGEERDTVFARAVEASPGWEEYETSSGRRLPVVALRPIDGAPDDLGAWGDELAVIHDAFRRELATVRQEVRDNAGSTLGAQLRINCLHVCRGLAHHHTTEDAEMLPVLDEKHPELRPVVAQLRREHEEIARLLDELRSRLSDEDIDPASLGDEVDRLTGEVERHLDYEERELVPTLNAMTPR